jgi:hypothetical protein
MFLYAVFEMGMDRDILVAVFLDKGDAMKFVKACPLEIRSMIPIPNDALTVAAWYALRDAATNQLNGE